MLTANTPANSRYDTANAICYIFPQYSSCHRCSFIQMTLNPHNQSTKITKDVLSHLHCELQTLSKPLRCYFQTGQKFENSHFLVYKSSLEDEKCFYRRLRLLRITIIVLLGAWLDCREGESLFLRRKQLKEYHEQQFQ